MSYSFIFRTAAHAWCRIFYIQGGSNSPKLAKQYLLRDIQILSSV